MKLAFDDTFNAFVNTLKDLAVVASSTYLFHLVQRMSPCQTNTLERWK